MRNIVLKVYVKAQCTLSSLKNKEDGQDLIEYALLTALIALAAITTVKTIGNTVNTIFTSISTQLSAAV